MAIKTVSISFTGQMLIDALKAVAKRPVVHPFQDQKILVFELGQVSESLSQHFRVTVDGGIDFVSPNDTYSCFTAATYQWPAILNDEPFNEDNADDAAETLAEMLQLRLQMLSISRQIAARPIVFTFEGVKYECPQTAYETNEIILPDGRVLSADGWLEIYPPIPENLHVVRTLKGVFAKAI